MADIKSELAGFGPEQVAGSILECMAGFVGMRIPAKDGPMILFVPGQEKGQFPLRHLIARQRV